MKDGEQRLVVKRALAKDGVAHIRKMSDYYEKNKDEGMVAGLLYYRKRHKKA